MNYRADIDGLRALAVMPVVLFHAGVPGFSGGYVGVDVFFVISGFLIARLIWSDIQAGSFSLPRFYERRARRILPALFVVAGVTFLIGALILVPEDLDDLSASLVATVGFSANLYFWHETDYFALDAELRPLLHAWSLGVEEQFYIVFPALLIWLSRAAPRIRFSRARNAVLAIGFGSLLLSAVTLGPLPEMTFFFLTMRAWELLLGAGLGMGFIAQAGRRQAGVAAALGLIALGLAVALFDRMTPFPGPYALLPCLGAALLLWAGEGNGRGNPITRLLSLRPLVWLGLISYSLYLWHWPLLVYAHYWLDRPLDGAAIAAVLVLALALSLVTWRWVEQPFRRSGSTGGSGFSGSHALRIAVASGAVLATAGLVGMLSDGLPQRLAPQARAFADIARDRSSGHCKYDPSREALKADDFCIIGRQRAGAPDFFVWGDSHASAALPAIKLAAEKTGGWGLMIWQPGCPPLLGVSRSHEADGPDCLRFNRAVRAYLNTHIVKNVILVARWNQTILGHPALDIANRKPDILVTDDLSAEASQAENIAASRRGLASTFRGIAEGTGRLGSASRRRIWFVEQMPFAGFNVPKRLVRSAMAGEVAPDQSADFSEGARRQREAMSLIAPILQRDDVRVIDPWPALCVAARCAIAKGGRSLFRDDDHLSAIGAQDVAPVFEAATMPGG